MPNGEKGRDGSRELWRAAAAAFATTSVALLVVFSDLFVVPEAQQAPPAASRGAQEVRRQAEASPGRKGGQVGGAKEAAKVPWVLNAAQTGCRNWASAQLGHATTEGSAHSCGVRCRKHKGCVGFSFRTSCSEPGSCILRTASCEMFSNTCWDDYNMVLEVATPPAERCADGVGGLNFCSEWCNDARHWGCGRQSHAAYTCDCTGCNGCVASSPVTPPAARPSSGLARKPALPAAAQAEPASLAPAVAVPKVPTTPPPDELPPGWPRLPPVPPEGVRLPAGWKTPWDGPPASAQAIAGATFGFYFPVFNLGPPAILAVIRDVRKYYPDSPIHVLQDGGFVNFGKVCALPEYGCSFEQVKPENSRWNPHSWLIRMHRVAKQLGTTYVIYLEPDVLIRGRHRWHPPHDAGGMYDNYNPGIHEETAAYMQRLGRRVNPCFKLRWRHFGLAGGSYYRTAALLDAFDPDNVAKIDWGALFRIEGERIFSSDLAMHVALSARGFTVYPWRESAQKWNDGAGAPPLNDPAACARFALKWPAFNPLAAFEHNHKEHYSDRIPPREQALLNERLPMYPDLFCHGCVWFRGPKLQEAIPVKEPQSWTLHPPPDLEDDEYRVHPERVREETVYAQGPSADDVCFKGSPAAAAPAPSAAPAPRARPKPARPTTTETPPSSVTSPSIPSAYGLPFLEQRPAWLMPADGLIVDGRAEPRGGMLLAHTVLVDGRREWGDKAARPGWVRAALATNRAHAKRHGHAMVVRWKPTLRFPPPWQEALCDRKENKVEIQNCWLNTERENFNWEKHQMMLDYLEGVQGFSHVLVLDADAVLVRPDFNTLQQMAKELDKAGKELLLTNEDWIGDVSSKTRINGGLLFAKNTPFVRDLFRDMLDAHWYQVLPEARIGGGEIRGCASNEQLCLDSIQYRPKFKEKVLITSGLKYNCGVNDKAMHRLKQADPSLDIMHFMGGSKSAAVRALCQIRDLTGEGPKGYGCAP